MHRLILALLALLVLSVVAAGVYLLFQPENGLLILASTSAATPTRTEDSPTITIRTGPRFANWSMGDNPVVSQGDYTFAVHVAELTEEQTVAIYSLSGAAVKQLLAGSQVHMRDDKGRSYPSSNITLLAQLPRLQLGVITFGPRVLGARELHAVLTAPQGGGPLEADVVKLVGAGEGPSTPGRGILGAPYREGYLEQAGYRISFNGWELEKRDRVAVAQSAKPMTLAETMREAATLSAAETPHPGKTVTPVPVSRAALELSGGQPVKIQGTLRVEDIQAKQVQYLYFVVLDSGEVKATLLQ